MPNWKQMLDTAAAGEVPPEQLPPYMRFLSLPLISDWRNKAVDIQWQVDPDSFQDSGMVFGGYISSLADYAAGSTMLTILEEQDLFFTKKLEIEYLRPIREGLINISGRITDQTGINVTVEVRFENLKKQTHAVAQVYQSIFSR